MSILQKNLGSLSNFLSRNPYQYLCLIFGLFLLSGFKAAPYLPPSLTSNQTPTVSFHNTTLLKEEFGKNNLLKEQPIVATTDSLITYALKLKGTPYSWGGASRKGFDCSGFVYYVFDKFGINLKRSSRQQSTEGNRIPLKEVRKGDLLFFTGTNPEVRRVGHVGIVISEAGDPVKFVHASSSKGVKISKLKGYYSTRFMLARRLLANK